MSREYVRISEQQFADMAAADSSGELEPWRSLVDRLHATFSVRSFSAAAALAASIAALADEVDHHPDLNVRYPGIVHVVITTHAAGGLTLTDVESARAISRLATAAAADSRPTGAQTVELAIDTADAARIRPFWRAVLGYIERNGNLHDPKGIGPSMWFQTTDEPRPQRNRIHLDVIVSHDEAPARIEAALAAGGTLVTDRFARSWWVLADADGNEACICTWQDRGD